jgi:hypothetical protein
MSPTPGGETPSHVAQQCGAQFHNMPNQPHRSELCWKTFFGWRHEEGKKNKLFAQMCRDTWSGFVPPASMGYVAN